MTINEFNQAVLNSANEGMLPDGDIHAEFHYQLGGVAFTKVYHPTEGYQINLTGRGPTAALALEDLRAGIAHAKELGLVMHPPEMPRSNGSTPPSPPSPSPVVRPPRQVTMSEGNPTGTPGEEMEMIEVSEATVEMSANGQKTLKVKGGPVSKFGVICWPEVAAEVFDMNAAEVGKTYDMTGYKAQVLKVGGKYKKVLAFEVPTLE